MTTNDLPDGCVATLEHCTLHVNNALAELGNRAAFLDHLGIDTEQLAHELGIALQIAEIFVKQHTPKYKDGDVVWLKEVEDDDPIPREKATIVGDPYPSGPVDNVTMMYVVVMEPESDYADGPADVSEDQIEGRVEDIMREIAGGNIERNLGDVPDGDSSPDSFYKEALTLATAALHDAGYTGDDAAMIAHSEAMKIAQP